MPEELRLSCALPHLLLLLSYRRRHQLLLHLLRHFVSLMFWEGRRKGESQSTPREEVPQVGVSSKVLEVVFGVKGSGCKGSQKVHFCTSLHVSSTLVPSVAFDNFPSVKVPKVAVCKVKLGARGRLLN